MAGLAWHYGAVFVEEDVSVCTREGGIEASGCSFLLLSCGPFTKAMDSVDEFYVW